MTDHPTPEYLYQLPTSVPDGRWLVHNHVYPVARRPGARGSRIWLSDPDPALLPCPCGWAPELGTHYRPRAFEEGRGKLP